MTEENFEDLPADETLDEDKEENFLEDEDNDSEELVGNDESDF
ncbi:MAG: hypothetical protein WC849_02920 [Candidatus Paceibacterota bacterium]